MSFLSDKLIYKIKAASIHLLISVCIFCVILYLIFFEWYPEPFFTAQGGVQGIRLMAMVDLVLGPTLTFIVYNHFKQRKEIILDLSVIAIIQIVALIWGGYSVYSQRPVALVYWDDAFYTVTSDDYVMQGIKEPDLLSYSAHVPPLIFSRKVTNKLELEQTMQQSEKGIPVYAQIELYDNIAENLPTIFSKQVDILAITAKNSAIEEQLKNIVKGNFSAFNYIALRAKYQNMILVMDDRGNIVGEIKTP